MSDNYQLLANIAISKKEKENDLDEIFLLLR